LSFRVVGSNYFVSKQKKNVDSRMLEDKRPAMRGNRRWKCKKEGNWEKRLGDFAVDWFRLWYLCRMRGPLSLSHSTSIRSRPANHQLWLICRWKSYRNWIEKKKSNMCIFDIKQNELKSMYKLFNKTFSYNTYFIFTNKTKYI
jgi:hypothetical protein